MMANHRNVMDTTSKAHVVESVRIIFVHASNACKQPMRYVRAQGGEL